MKYRVTLRKHCVKFLERLSEPYYSQIKDAIYALAENPKPAGYKKLTGRDGYRIRVGRYRIIYEILGDTVDILDIGHRKDIYR